MLEEKIIDILCSYEISNEFLAKRITDKILLAIKEEYFSPKTEIEKRALADWLNARDYSERKLAKTSKEK